MGLKEGDKVSVSKKSPSGWWLGMNMRTQKSGYFPASYVELDSRKAPELIGASSITSERSEDRQSVLGSQRSSLRSNKFGSRLSTRSANCLFTLEKDARVGSWRAKLMAERSRKQKKASKRGSSRSSNHLGSSSSLLSYA